MNEDIIKRIREMMSFYGMNTSQFAEKTNINQANLSSMLNGKRVIGDGIINKICISFDNINKDWLLSGEGEMFRNLTHQDSLFPELRDIFDRIMELSIIKGVTVHTVSKDTGVPLSNLVRSESDRKQEIDQRDIEKLADYYCVNADWLLTGKGDAYAPGIVQDTMVKDEALWNRLSDIINMYYGGENENIHDLSDYTGISANRLMQIIEDNTWPLYSEIQKIIKSEKLNISAQWLLTGEGDMFKNESERIPPGDLLQLYLKEKGITKEEFADKMGISIEEADKHFNLKDGNMDYMHEWAMALGTKTTELFMSADTYLMYMERESDTLKGKEQNNVKYISPYLSEDLVQIPYVPISAAASFVESLYGEPYIDETFGVLFEDGEYTNHTEYRVFNISGDSMEPTIRNRSKVLCKEISIENWEYAKGVIIIVYGKTLTIKRILKNDLYIHNALSLKADNPTYGEITVERSEIKGIWQALRVVSMEIV